MAITCSVLGNQGRIGNQLWQVASTIGLGRKYGEKVVLPAWDYRPYFNVPEEYWEDDGSARTEAADLATNIHPSYRNYLQDFSFWIDIQDEVWEWFQPSGQARPIMTAEQYRPFWDEWGIGEQALISLHVRRGDNVTNPEGTIQCLEDAYFLRAAENIEADLTKSAMYAVFSDDIEWCKGRLPDLLPGRRLLFTDPNYIRPKEHLPEYQTSIPMDWVDMLLMAECDYHILSNSTYSWWGAFLASAANYPRYPEYWFGRQITKDYDPSVAFPPGWVKIPCRKAR